MKRIGWLFLTTLFTGCDEGPSFPVKEKENTKSKEYDLIKTAASPGDFDKKSMEEVRYIVELTDKIADANKRFLNFIKSLSVISNTYLSSKEEMGQEMSFNFTPKAFGGMSINSVLQSNEDFLMK